MSEGLERSLPLFALSAWFIVPTIEVVLSQSSMVPPQMTQVLFEFLAFALFGVSQFHFFRKSPKGAMASGLWPAILMFSVTALAISTPGLGRLIDLAGIFICVYLVLKLLKRASPQAVAILTIVSALTAPLGARYLMLSFASAIAQDERGDSVVVANAGGQLEREMLRALPSFEGKPLVASPPIVVISVDTLRASDAVMMSSYQRIAAAGRGWPKASSTSSWTLPAMASLHTGEMPGVHGADGRPGGHYQGISPDVPTLADQLSDVGYTTAAVVTNPWLESTLGFARGFDDYLHANEALPHRLLFAGIARGPISIDAEAIVDKAIEKLDDLPESGFFLWVHLLDPHMPYFHATEGAGAGLTDGELRSGKLTTPIMRREIQEAYRAEVAHADLHINRLLDALVARGLFEEGLVVFAADHGEEFWEHGGAEHGHSHHHEVTDVAMAVAGAGVVQSQNGVVSLQDIAPTALMVAGVEVSGVDLRRGAPEDRVVSLYGNNYYRLDRSARDSRGRLILRGDPAPSPSAVYYDHSTDPNEQTPIPVGPDNRLWLHARSAEAPEEAEAAEINQEALRALGYVE